MAVGFAIIGGDECLVVGVLDGEALVEAGGLGVEHEVADSLEIVILEGKLGLRGDEFEVFGDVCDALGAGLGAEF